MQGYCNTFPFVFLAPVLQTNNGRPVWSFAFQNVSSYTKSYKTGINISGIVWKCTCAISGHCGETSATSASSVRCHNISPVTATFPHRYSINSNQFGHAYFMVHIGSSGRGWGVDLCLRWLRRCCY